MIAPAANAAAAAIRFCVVVAVSNHTQTASAATGIAGPPGSLTVRAAEGIRRRRIGTAAAVPK